MAKITDEMVKESADTTVFIRPHVHAVDSGTASKLKNVTLCVVVMKNGFTVIGKSACVDYDEFNIELGRKFAWEDAKRQIVDHLAFVYMDLATQKSPSYAAVHGTQGGEETPCTQAAPAPDKAEPKPFNRKIMIWAVNSAMIVHAGGSRDMAAIITDANVLYDAVMK